MLSEIRPTWTLAWPVIAAELGWMAMGVVDTVMVGPLGSSSIAAVGLGHILTGAFAVFGLGLLLGLDTMVSQSHGARHHEQARLALVQGLFLAVAVALFMTPLAFRLPDLLPALGYEPRLLAATSSYLKVVAWGLPPLLLFTALRRYLQGVGQVRPIMVALLSANVVNVVVNALLIRGLWGFPALGVAGAAWATVLSRCLMALVLFLALMSHEPGGLGRLPWRIDWRLQGRLWTLGLPAAMQYMLEYGVFAAATILAGKLGSVPLAAHHMALLICSVTFMVPLGLSSAGAVRVGHAVGARRPVQASAAGWSVLVLGATFMTVAGITLVAAPRPLLALFSPEPAALALGSRLLLVAAAFQLFDGIQIVSTGNLRGLGDTRTPMIASLAAHWGVGLPVGCLLAFGLKMGVLGLWIGLSLGLVGVAIVLLTSWRLQSRRLSHATIPGSGEPAPLPEPGSPLPATVSTRSSDEAS